MTVSDRSKVIGRNIAAARKVLGMLQRELGAEMAEAGHAAWVHRNTVSRIERGLQDVTFGEAQDLMAILGPRVFAGTQMPGAERVANESAFVVPRLDRVETELRDALKVVGELRAVFDDEEANP